VCCADLHHYRDWIGLVPAFPPIGAAKGRVRAKSFVRGSGRGMMG